MNREVRFNLLYALIIIVCIAFTIEAFKFARNIHYKFGYESKIEKQIEASICQHEIMQSEVDSKLMTMYVPILLFTKRQIVNQMMIIDYCAKCGIIFVNDSTTYTYSELFDKVAP